MSWHDDAVSPGGIQIPQVGEGVRKLGSENERVHRDVPFYPVRMEKTHQLRQGIQCEIVGAQAGVEAVQAEVDGIRAVGDGGAGAVHVSGGGQQFGANIAGAQGGKGGVVFGNHSRR